MLNINICNELVRTTDKPLLLLFILINNKHHFTDDEMSIIIRLFLKYHSNTYLSVNISYFKNYLENYIMSQNTIDTFYNIISKQLKIIPFLVKIKNAFPYKYFWKLGIDKQILFLEKKVLIIKAIFDNTKNTYSFIDYITKVDEKYYNSYTNELIKRLMETLKIVQYPFIKSNKIQLITIDDMYNLTWENRIKYAEYFYSNCIKYLTNYIKYLELFNTFQLELNNLLNPKIIKINDNYINDEIDSDIDFIYE